MELNDEVQVQVDRIRDALAELKKLTGGPCWLSLGPMANSSDGTEVWFEELYFNYDCGAVSVCGSNIYLGDKDLDLLVKALLTRRVWVDGVGYC